jgi:hypothetical protein
MHSYSLHVSYRIFRRIFQAPPATYFAGALDGWSLTTAELRRWATSGCQAPVLSLRGQHDFVTEDGCRHGFSYSNVL